MSNTERTDDAGISRRRLLQATGGAVGAIGLGSAPATADGSHDGTRDYCSEATLEPGMVHYDDSIHEVCSDDHLATRKLQADVRGSLQRKYPTVGALIDDGFIPYFDFFTDSDWAHWINPKYIADDSIADPDRPESVLVDNTWWRPIGVMFIATREGDPVDPPPTVYTDSKDRGCTPWHAHVGFPGRYSWWKYRKAYHGHKGFPCRTPWMMHLWIHSHPKSIYAHAAPEDRGGPPAEPPGFKTDANPAKEELGPEHLPDMVHSKLKYRK